MNDLLTKAIELPIYMYSSLETPIFKGQTSMDDDHKYWVVVESKGTLYKMQCDL